MYHVSFLDFIFSIPYLVTLLLLGNFIKTSNKIDAHLKKYFFTGFTLKLIGVLGFCFVYLYVYGGGDTVNYFRGADVIINLAKQNTSVALSILSGNLSYHNYTYFNHTTGWPAWYMWIDANTFSVSRLTSLFALLGVQNFFATSLLVASATYIGIWKFYRLACEHFPHLHKQFAYAVLYFPSLIFWGSGIMKDSFTLSCACWLTYNFYQIAIKRQRVLPNILMLLCNLYIILNMKAYVLITLMPGLALWYYSHTISNIKLQIIKWSVLPVLLFIIFISLSYMIRNLQHAMGDYGSVDTMLQKAKVIQGDLLRAEQYGSNSYYIGQLDGTLGNALSRIPISVFTALYRPLPNEIGSIMMVLSVVENIFLLMVTAGILWRTKIIGIIAIIRQNTFIQFTLAYTLVFAFGVGLASTNFGALVRYKIPMVPHFLVTIVVLHHFSKRAAGERLINAEQSIPSMSHPDPGHSTNR
ncbi:MAG: hypothetical protein H6585_01345 [Flavobacteriales bacterium]|nr:hypothetical protein [Flavobacteriales bacterium]